MQQTTLNWLKTIENPDIRDKAITNFEKQSVTDLQEQKDSLHEALTDGFVWDRTPEGLDYWANTAMMYKPVSI